MHIGLLEDDPAIQEMLQLMLQDEGYTVTTYLTAQQCLQALVTTRPATSPIDLLIIDWRLQGQISGIEVIRQIRRTKQFKSLPIILTTAAMFSDMDALQNLQVALLENPFAIEEMESMIDELLQSHSSSGN